MSEGSHGRSTVPDDSGIGSVRPDPGQRRHLLCLALGTRGDVQPLHTVCCWLARSHRGKDATPGTDAFSGIHFLTHAAHREWLCEHPGVKIHKLDEPPARQWLGAMRTSGSPGPGGASKGQETIVWPLVEACVRLLEGERGKGYAGGSRETSADHGFCLIMLNLFSLEGYHLAEKYHMPCVAFSPYLIPYSIPSGFAKRFSRSHPGLFKKLTDAALQRRGIVSATTTPFRHPGSGSAAVQGTEPADSPHQAAEATGSDPGLQLPVSWAEVQHWMWPLFTERWAGLRSFLQLPAVPLTQLDGESPLQPWPAAVPLLYGFSSLVQPRAGHWPPTVQVVGYCRYEKTSEGPSTGSPPRAPSGSGQAEPEQESDQNLPGSCSGGDPATCTRASLPAGMGDTASVVDQLVTCLASGTAGSTGAAYGSGRHGPEPYRQASCGAEAFAAAAKAEGRSVICVDFGSMGRMGLIPVPPAALVTTVLAGVVGVGSCCLLLCGWWEPLWQAAAALHQDQALADPGRLHVVEGMADHDRLLPLCRAILHHGGSGTVSAALHAGLPQILAPVQYDQFSWAERLHWLGLAPTPLSWADLGVVRDMVPESMPEHPPACRAVAGHRCDNSQATLPGASSVQHVLDDQQVASCSSATQLEAGRRGQPGRAAARWAGGEREGAKAESPLMSKRQKVLGRGPNQEGRGHRDRTTLSHRIHPHSIPTPPHVLPGSRAVASGQVLLQRLSWALSRDAKQAAAAMARALAEEHGTSRVESLVLQLVQPQKQ